jgi:uncharacterized protein YbbK (DUF523 family)
MTDVCRHGESFPRLIDFTSGEVVLVSACLVGMPTRYDGSHALNEELMRKLADCRWVPVCPEELGGLPTPRPAADLVGGDGAGVLRGSARVVDVNGKDVTAAFAQGAQRVLEVAKRLKVSRCYLKGRSPSCGARASESGGKVRGEGVCAALLRENGFEVVEVG